MTDHTIVIQHNEYEHVHWVLILDATISLPISPISDYNMPLTVNQCSMAQVGPAKAKLKDRQQSDPYVAPANKSGTEKTDLSEK